MNRTRIITVAVMALMLFLPGLALKAGAAPHVQFPSPDMVSATSKDVKEIQEFYARVEDAMMKKDIDAMMKFYADDYFHKGITKEQVKGLWTNIFNSFERLNSAHIFSSVNVQGNDAAIVCTGTLYGIPKDSKEAMFVTVDRWTNQDHYLSKINGNWQIVGGATHWMQNTNVKRGGKIEYQMEFHPLF